MLIGFTVGNYRSFKDPTTFSMVAAKISSKPESLDKDNTFQVDDMQLLKSVAMYGANGSGKSNFIDAFRFMREFVMNSSRANQIDDPIPVSQFRLSTETEGQPSFFEIVFILEKTQYRYGFEVTQTEVVAEWLYDTPSTRERRLFERENDQIIIGTAFKEGKKIEDKTRNNALFLSVVAQFNGKTAGSIFRWFIKMGIISGLSEDSYRPFTLSQIENEHYHKSIVSFMQKLDVANIQDIISQEKIINTSDLPKDMPDEIKRILTSTGGEIKQTSIHTKHPKFNSSNEIIDSELFDLDDESDGTQKLFLLSGPILDTLQEGKILLIDELDSRLHPLITCAIINLFNSTTTNPKNAQLIFTTHDTNLLSNKLFRRDQIWFAEKDRFAATHLHSLVEYKVRNDASFENDYIQGKYGAIPFVGDLSAVVGENNAETIQP